MHCLFLFLFLISVIFFAIFIGRSVLSTSIFPHVESSISVGNYGI
jgi:hypothetical protein